ncbi:MAG: ABC transporter ATP-binding protein [Anaerofustis stercorihominis]|nr:ABC transporter ATP-binding protein [Anaerofustis stercorihominis]
MQNTNPQQQFAIELKGICKSFGTVKANDNIDLNVKFGEILALLGENGSGKTTLMNMLSGIYQPDGGEIYVDGNKVNIQNPEEARRLGIGMVHQHFKLVDVMTATDNITLSSKGGLFVKKGRYKEIEELSKKYAFTIDPQKLISQMSVSEKQTVEILKLIYNGAKILILDEPTAVLTPQETEKLFDILRNMKKEGCAIIIITHKLNEVMSISDRVTILHKGRSVATVDTEKTNPNELTELMVGHPMQLSIKREECTEGEDLLHVHHLTLENSDGAEVIKKLSFDLRGGEILGVAGVAGSGQKELCEAIAGLYPIKKGAVLYKDINIEGKTPREIIDLGISMSFIPEDRLGMGLAASLNIVDNMLLKTYRDNKGLFVDRESAEVLANKVVEELEIKTPDVHTPVRQLSGGNVQKVLLGREIEANPSVIITAYAVRGLDINSSYTIYDALNEQKKRGVGILFIGEDLDVMLELCDRIMVLCHGQCSGIVNAKETTKDYLGLLMTATVTEGADNE